MRNALVGVARGTKLASQLLAFGRRQTLQSKVINIGRLLRTLDDMLRRALGEAIEIESVVAGGLWNTFADPTQLETALLNLAINARDAMRGRGNSLSRRAMHRSTTNMPRAMLKSCRVST